MEVKRLIGKFSENNLNIIQTGGLYQFPEDLREKSDSVWVKYEQESKAQGFDVWNGVVYRLQKVEEANGIYTLYLGTLSFKEHKATSSFLEEVNRLPFFERPNGMFTECYLRTSDGKFIFGIKKVNDVEKAKLIGGNLNEDEMKITEGDDLFGYFLKEFEEETGLSPENISVLKGVGIFIALTSRINVCLYGEMPMTFDEFLKAAKPNYEHDSFFGLFPDELLDSPLVSEGVKQVFKYV